MRDGGVVEGVVVKDRGRLRLGRLHQRTLERVGRERQGVRSACVGPTVRALEQRAHPEKGFRVTGEPILGRGGAGLREHQHEGQHREQERRPLAGEELRVEAVLLMVDQHPSWARRDEGEDPEHDLRRSAEPLPGCQIGLERPAGTGHQGEPHIGGT